MATTQQAYMESINPATEQVMARYPVFSPDQVDRALVQARWAFRSWRNTSFAERAALFHGAAAYLRDNKERLATTITLEMGKPIVEAEAEVEKCAWNCDFYADNAARFLADEPHPSNASESYVVFDPLGVVLGIMPWNYPFWQVFRFAVPTLMAGNTVLIKHASNVPQSAIAVEEVFRESGFPEGVFRTLLISGTTAEGLIADPRVAAASLTGSVAAGRAVGGAAGRAVKPSVLELGGSDPFIVLEDADVAEAARVAVQARNQNNGQTCIAAKRLIVAEQVYEEFVSRLVSGVGELVMGDPLERTTQIGPLARADLRDALERQVQESVRLGAQVLVGGKRPAIRGYYYLPTVLGGVTPDMPAYREETFGPVAAVIRVRSADEAIAVANDTTFGLSSNLWTRDIARAKELARRIEAGNVYVNGMTVSDPRLPFGGTKQSGYGRELSEFGIRSFVNVKTVWIGPAREGQPPKAPSE